MNIQIPKSIKKISSTVAAHVRAHYPNIVCVEDFPVNMQLAMEDTCKHEMWYQDCNRFIGDVYQQRSMESR